MPNYLVKKVGGLFLIVIVTLMVLVMVGESNEDVAISLIRDHTIEGRVRSMGDEFQKVVGEEGSVTWDAFRPSEEPNEDIYCVDIVLERNQQHAQFQYMVNVETKNWEGSFLALNGEPLAFTSSSIDEVWRAFGEN